MAAPVRGTQSFVGTLTQCRRHPGWTGLEILWRWIFGVPALLLVVAQVKKVLEAATGGTLDPGRVGLDKALLNDPVGALTADPLGAVRKFTGAIALVWPGLRGVALWVVPSLLVLWMIWSSLGRTVVLRCVDPEMQPRPLTLMGLQAIRLAALGSVLLLWSRGMLGSARVAIAGPMTAGQEPNLVGYCALVIVLTLGLFVLWNAVSWYFSIAPLLAMLRGLGVAGSLRAAGQLGALKGKLVEINLVLGIVKIALLVLAMVFSATPLPFESVTTIGFLAWWWAGVITVYLVASDFFHVARLVSYTELWRTVLPQHTAAN